MPGGTLATYKFLSSFIKDVRHISIINKNFYLIKIFKFKKIKPRNNKIRKL